MGRGLATEEQPIDEIRPTLNRAVGTRSTWASYRSDLNANCTNDWPKGQLIVNSCTFNRGVATNRPSKLTCAIVCMTMAKKHR
jgi:hypothetical protein